MTLANKGYDIDNIFCVISVPAQFKNNQIEATIEAAQNAGLIVVDTITEPSAAAAAHGINPEKAS